MSPLSFPSSRGIQVKLNTDESPSIATEYGIRSIPTVMIFKNGEKRGFEGSGRAGLTCMFCCLEEFLREREASHVQRCKYSSQLVQRSISKKAPLLLWRGC